MARHGAKVGHRKSRTGCKKCKARRVKCDETHPVCRNCSRLALDCAWPDTRFRPTPSPDPASLSIHNRADSDDGSRSQDSGASNPLERFFAMLAPQGDHAIFPSLAVDQDVDLPESKQRRLLEHRLMLNYVQNLAQPFPISPSRDWQQLFTRVMPKLALTHDNLLYAMLTVSASNLLLAEPDDMDLFSARQSYLILTMREQRNMVERLSVETADAVCFTSLLLLLNSFTMLRERKLEPYMPPLEWLHMGRGAGTVIWMSIQAAHQSGDFTQSSIYIISKSYPRFGGQDESYFDPAMRKDLNGILTQAIPCGEVWDDDTKEAYEKTLSYVGSVQNAIHNGEPVYALLRRIQAFPLLLPSKFVGFLEECRPRALVVLAHFFATVAQVQGVWWLGADQDESTAKREIRAISKVLAPEWQPQLVWPLDMVGLR